VNLRRGFFRITVIASVLIGVFVMILWPKPSLEEFRLRPATEVEKNDSKKWEALHAGDDFKNLSHEDSDKMLDTFLINHGGKLLKNHQGILPLQFAAEYCLAPFFAGVLATWIGYGLVKYVTTGFNV